MNKKSRVHGSSRIKYFIVGAAVLTVGLIIYFGYESTTYEVETFKALKGEFIIDVKISGMLKARKSQNIACPRSVGLALGLELKIVKLVPEGEYVEKGDFLIQFDASELENRLHEREKDLATKYQELEVLLAQQRTDSVRRENQLKKDRMNLELSKIKFSKSQFEAEIKKQRDQINMRKAELELLDKIDNIKIEKLNDIEELNIKYEEIKRIKKYVDDYKKQLEEATIYAPISGLVVYKEVYMGLYSGILSKEKIRLGASGIYYRDPLIELPDLSEMCVEVAVNEIEVGKIKRNQEVIIKLDTDERVYYGTVSRIATLAEKVYVNPNTRDEFRNLYTVEIAIKNTEENAENDGALIPGMSATCTIITDRLQDAVYIPIQSVIEVEDETFVYVKEGGTYRKTPVITGIKNNDYIVVKEGLEPGQLVALSDPYKKLQDVGEKIKEKQ